MLTSFTLASILAWDSILTGQTLGTSIAASTHLTSETHLTRCACWAFWSLETAWSSLALV